MADYPYRISYGSVLNQVAAYYGQGSPVWDAIVSDSSTGFSSANYGYLEQIGINPILAKDGSVLGYYQTAPMPSHSGSTYEVVNSNQQAGTYSGNSTTTKINGTATQTQVSGKTKTTFNSGAKTVSGGTTVATTALNILSGVGVVALAGRLGKAVNDAFYDSGASWAFSDEQWSDLYWDSDGLGKFLLSTLYGVNGENGTMYMDERALAQTYMLLREMGAYSDGGIEIEDIPLAINTPITANDLVVGTFAQIASIIGLTEADITYYQKWYPQSLTPYALLMKDNNNKLWLQPLTSLQGLEGYDSYIKSSSYGSYVVNQVVRLAVPNKNWALGGTRTPGYNPTTLSGMDELRYVSSRNQSTGVDTIVAGRMKIQPTVEGIENDDQATTYIDPSLIDGQDRDTVLQQLKTNYPELFNDSIYADVPQQDGTNKRITYVPVPMPNIANQNKPVTGDNHQNNPSTNPQTNTEDLLQQIADMLTTLTTPTDIPDTGTGETPPTVIPVGNASSLWKIYNPTQAQVDAFGSWLWDSSFVEQIKKLFNDPMQAIIGIHKVFATPSTGGTATIKVGYLDSQVSSAWVDNQYTTVNCGSASLKEYFGNVFDYAPYTKVQLYLPFIGIVDLDVGDVMRSTISVVYHVDVLTGACLADVKVNRDGVGGVLYQYAGSAIVTYPISSGTYLGVIAGIGAVATGAVASIMTGGMAGAALGVAGTATGLAHLHANVSHSGNFSGCAGAMGGKKPYLIVSRPQIAMADNYQHYTGIPANSKVTLGNCDGYAKVKSVYVNSITRATEEEKNMIEAQLKAGVLV